MTTGKEIKQRLKEKGFDVSKISVKKSRGGYCDAFYITIKSPYINKRAVERVVRGFENYERDERTLEILAGGNTFVFVNYDYHVFDEIKEHNREQTAELLKFFEREDVKINGWGLRVGNGTLFKEKGENFCYLLFEKKSGLNRMICELDDLTVQLFKLEQFGEIVY